MAPFYDDNTAAPSHKPSNTRNMDEVSDLYVVTSNTYINYAH